MAMSKTERSWVLYDWANSAYSLIITTALLPIFFKSYAAGHLEDVDATAYWGYANSIGMLLIAFAGPVLGGIADHRGLKKPIFAVSLLLGVLATASLAVVGEGQWLLCLVIYGVSAIGFNAAWIVYDAFLVDVTTEKRMDWISGAGFALGYLGSTIPFVGCMAILLFQPPVFGLDDSVTASRAAFVVTAVWWLVFSVPFLRHVKQQHFVADTGGVAAAAVQSVRRIGSIFRRVRRYRMVFLFLVAYFLYIDGVHTIINMATVFAIDIGVDQNEILVILLVVQLIGIPAALIYARLAKTIGPKRMVLFGIGVYTFVTVYAYFIETAWQFWVLAILVGTSQGGIQALSRSIYARIIPKSESSQFFGFYDVFGKFAAILGPALTGVFAQLTGRTQSGVLSLVVLFVVGGVVLSRVQIPNESMPERAA